MKKSSLNRDKAKMYVSLAYRNIHILESMHVSGKELNMQFYNRMVKATADSISENQKDINRTIEILGMNHEDIPKISEDDKQRIVKPTWALNMILGDHWDEPVKVSARYTKEITPLNISEYVLDGEFKNMCSTGAILNDDIMCVLNHDVINRFYTLVCRGIL